MEWPTLVAMLAIVQYLVFGVQVGVARGRYGVAAPATAGHPQFERIHRIHQNTLEQLIVFLPSLWAFSLYIDPLWGAAVGVPYLAGRALYAVSYARNPETRGRGMLLTAVPCHVLLAGGLLGALWSLTRG
jgi:hypothetical protein